MRSSFESKSIFLFEISLVDPSAIFQSGTESIDSNYIANDQILTIFVTPVMIVKIKK